jgi:Domain of unknown function (DUF5667)
MTPVFATRRHAEEFEAVVDGLTTRTASDDRYDDLLELVGALRAVPQPVARAEFVSQLRERLVAEAAAMPIVAAAEAERLRLRSTDPGRVARPRERRVAVALGGLALVGATTAMAVVAQSALPGDVLYPLKRAVESAHVGVSVGDENKGSTLLASASTRLDEIEQLAQEDAGDRPAEISDTLNDFTEQAAEASDLLLTAYGENGDQQSVNDLNAFTASSMASLAALDGQLPETAQDEWAHAVTTLVRIDASASLTCPTCDATDLDAITPAIPAIGTGFGTGTLPAVDLPDVTKIGPALPSVGASELPPGSVTKPTPTAGGTDLPTALPTGAPTSLPSGLPTTVPSTGAPTAGVPTTVSTNIALPSVNPTALLSTLTGGPSLPPVPTDGVTQLLGGVASVLPTAVTSPLTTILP